MADLGQPQEDNQEIENNNKGTGPGVVNNLKEQAAEKAKAILKDRFKKFIVETIWKSGIKAAATAAWAALSPYWIPIVIIIAIIAIAIAFFAAALSCNGGRCSPDTPTGTIEDKKNTLEIEALADPKKNAELIANKGSSISTAVQKVSKEIQNKLETETDEGKKQQLRNGDDLINNKILPTIDQIVLAQGSSATNNTVISNLSDSLSVYLVQLIYNFNGKVLTKTDSETSAFSTTTTLPINPTLITGYGKTLHGFSAFNNGAVADHNVYKSIFNPDFGDLGRYNDAVDIAIAKGSPVWAPLSGIAYVYGRGTDQERIEIISNNNADETSAESGDTTTNASVILAGIKTSKPEDRFNVNAGDQIGTISDIPSEGQLHFQLSTGGERFSRSYQLESDLSFWLEMQLFLLGKSSDSSTQQVQGEISTF
ncbi:MAG: hypothetical protein WCW17_01375 [Patescibacteria group bacterium]|jgi:murein DD-endopeptidase MepM/ murein hydrolase activator NlpD